AARRAVVVYGDQAERGNAGQPRARLPPRGRWLRRELRVATAERGLPGVHVMGHCERDDAQADRPNPEDDAPGSHGALQRSGSARSRKPPREMTAMIASA